MISTKYKTGNSFVAKYSNGFCDTGTIIAVDDSSTCPYLLLWEKESVEIWYEEKDLIEFEKGYTIPTLSVQKVIRD